MASAVAHRATADAAEEEWIADTGATVTATTRSALVNPRASNKVLLGFADGDGKVTTLKVKSTCGSMTTSQATEWDSECRLWPWTISGRK